MNTSDYYLWPEYTPHMQLLAGISVEEIHFFAHHVLATCGSRDVIYVLHAELKVQTQHGH